LPYQRPPLSKAYLSGQIEAPALLLRTGAVYAQQRIELMLGERVEAIDRGLGTIRLASGVTLAYAHLVLALGARNRTLQLAGAELDGIAYLRTLEDAQVLRQRLGSVQRAAVARKHGIDVSVVEMAQRPMARAVTAYTSQYFVKKHESHGARIFVDTGIARIVGEREHVTHVELTNGSQIPADLVLVGIGVLPNSELAEAAGLTVRNGVVVDEYLSTSDPAISALGDCAAFPSIFADSMVRLESVQNAVDQARCIAAKLTGKQFSYASVPWFWSDQFDAKLQMPDEHSYSVYCFRGDQWLGVESVNRPGDHMAARKLLAAKIMLTPAQVADPSFDLKLFTADALAAVKPV
jgi:3-phenylpropionate/trans-cinnamate dioxygenase ferredoxin reductase subunit